MNTNPTNCALNLADSREGYLSPLVEVYLCEVERGFLLSMGEEDAPPSFSEEEGSVKDESGNWGY